MKNKIFLLCCLLFAASVVSASVLDTLPNTPVTINDSTIFISNTHFAVGQPNVMFSGVPCSSTSNLQIVVSDSLGQLSTIEMGALLSLLQQQQGILTPQQFGAIPDDNQCDDVAFNAMFQAAQNGAHTINIPPGVYNICNTVNLPNTTVSPYLKIAGYGAHLKASGDFTLFRRMPTNMTEAGVMINNHILRLEGFVFEGMQAGIGLEIGATYSLQVLNCHFIDLDIGLLSEFSLNGRYEGLRFTNCMDKSFVGADGSWAGANAINASFNGNRIESCRVFGRAGQSTHFELIAGDLNIIENCISEGSSPDVNVLIDTKAASVVNHAVTVRNFWIESQAYAGHPGSTYFKFVNFRDYATLEDVQAYPGVQADTLVHVESGVASSILNIKGYRGYTELINNLDGSIYGPYYIIDHTPATPNTRDDNPWLNGDNWVGGAVPRQLNMEWRRSQNTGETIISRHNVQLESRQ